MKKLISYLLILILVFSNVSIVCADGENPVSKEAYYENVAVGLGIVDKTLKDKEAITRAEFAITLTKLINETPINTSSTSYTDVAAGTKESAAIELLKNKGIMVGIGDGTFAPDTPILYMHAIRLILKATKNIKEFNSNEIISETNYEKLTKGVYLGENGTISYQTLTRLVYNALDMTIMPTTFDQIGTLSGDTNGGETVIKHFFNMGRVIGVLETDIHSSIKELTVDGKNISIDGVKYKSGKDYNESLGLKVDCFVDIDDNEVIFLTTHPENEVTTVIDRDLRYSPVDRIYTYIKDGKLERISIENTTDVVYNDRVMTTSSDAAMVPTNGYVTFINNDKDSDIDVIRIMQYTDIYISGKSTEDETVTIFENSGVSAVISTEETENGTVIMNAAGESATVKSLREGNVVSVLGDFVGKVPSGNTINARRVIISTDSILGKISEIDTSENVIVIDGEEHYMNDRFVAPSLGNNRKYTLYLNFMGKVAAMGAINRDDLPMAIGYVMDATINSDGKCVAKILTYENEIVKFICADKVRIEGSGSKTDQDAIKNLFDTNEKLIAFTVNDDKELNKVMFQTDYSNKKPTEIPQEFGLYTIGKSSTSGGSDAKYKYFQHYKSFFGRLTMNDDTIMFVIPSSGTLDASNCKVEPISSLVDEEYYDVDGYVFDKNSAYCDVVVVRGEVDREANEESTLGVIVKIIDTINEDDESIKQVTILGQNGEEVLYTKDANVLLTATKFDDGSALGRSIAPGDAVLYSVNFNNEITDFKVIYNKATDDIYSVGDISDGNNETRKHAFMEALVYDLDSNFIRLVNVNQNVETATFNDIEMLSFERVSIFVVEDDARKVLVKRGSTADIDAYLKNGKASRVLYKTAGFIGYFMLVIK